MSLEIVVSLNGRLPFLDSGPIGLEISLELLGIIVFKVDLTPNYLTRSSFRKICFFWQRRTPDGGIGPEWPTRPLPSSDPFQLKGKHRQRILERPWPTPRATGRAAARWRRPSSTTSNATRPDTPAGLLPSFDFL